MFEYMCKVKCETTSQHPTTAQRLMNKEQSVTVGVPFCVQTTAHTAHAVTTAPHAPDVTGFLLQFQLITAVERYGTYVLC